ncbi:MAG TPA: Holliday junction resolvase RuvX [Steroidobacteraceae bacterium]|nr:Holliday junction resolvase RuvX [Steroidobacteraceae bacterium]
MLDGEAGADAPGQPLPLLALGFDFGERRIGVAAGDTLTRGARPLGVVSARGGRPDWHGLDRYVREWQPRVLVVGVPYNMDGTPGRLTDAALGFAAELHDRYSLEVATVDERLSSREAEDILRRQRASGARTRRVQPGDVDSAAACVVLKQWLRGQGRAPRDE